MTVLLCFTSCVTVTAAAAANQNFHADDTSVTNYLLLFGRAVLYIYCGCYVSRVTSRLSCGILNKGWQQQLLGLRKVPKFVPCAAAAATDAAVFSGLTLDSTSCHVYIYCLLTTRWSEKS